MCVLPYYPYLLLDRPLSFDCRQQRDTAYDQAVPHKLETRAVLELPSSFSSVHGSSLPCHEH